MIVTREHVKLAVPVAAANLVPVAGVIFLGWKVLALFMLFWLETVVIVLIGMVHHIAAPAERGHDWPEKIHEGFGMLLPAFFFGAGQLWLIMGTVGLREMPRMDLTGNMLRDFQIVIVSLGLVAPTAILFVVHAVQEIRAWRSENRGLEMMLLGIARFFGLSFLLMAVAAAVIVYDAQGPALFVLVAVKAAFDFVAALVIKRAR
jgi:hypothetical protein